MTLGLGLCLAQPLQGDVCLFDVVVGVLGCHFSAFSGVDFCVLVCFGALGSSFSLLTRAVANG